MPCTYGVVRCGQKGLTIDGTLICFNFSVEVTSPVCAVPDLLHGKRVLGVWVYMYKKSRIDWKVLTVFNNEISFFVQRICKILISAVKWSCLHTLDSVCCLVEDFLDVHYTYKKAWFGEKGLIINRTLTIFNLCMVVTLPVYVGPGILHSKRVFGVWVCMYKKGWVNLKWLTIFYNQISFLSNGTVDFKHLYQIVPVSVH